MKPKIILGIETSCDETAAAVLLKDANGIKILSNVVASSANLQSKYGGIIPEQAAREQIKSIIPVIEESLQVSGTRPQDIDYIACTQGPGLIGSLLVGVETAKVLSLIWNKPLIPINHLIGHFYANWIVRGDSEQSTIPSFPCIGLLVSGGHTDLVLFKDHHQFKYLGGTRDDAAGECFDKCARLLNLPYPGGPQISKLAQKGNPKAFNLPRPLHDSKDFDFSFSGLKTAVANLVMSNELGVKEEKQNTLNPYQIAPQLLPNLCASIEQAIIDSLVKKTARAAKLHKVEQIIIAGGVAANQRLISDLKLEIRNLKLEIAVLAPPPALCTDNASMIASAAFFGKPLKNPLDLQANPNLSLAY